MSKSVFKINNTNIYIITSIIILLILNIFIFTYTIEKNKDDSLKNINFIYKQLHFTTKNVINALNILNTSMQNKFSHKEYIKIKYANKIKEVNKNGDFALDIKDMINITGFGGVSKDEKILKEMEIALLLTNTFNTVKQFSLSFAWVYYSSKNKFSATWPYLSSKKFIWQQSDVNAPLFSYAMPKNNPNKEIYYTPLYVDAAGLGLMVTLGHPFYYNDKFLGTINIDMTLKAINDILNSSTSNQVTLVVINKTNQIIGASNLKKFDKKIINDAKDFFSKKILDKNNNYNDFYLHDGKYYYIRKFSNAPWKLVGYIDQETLIINALINTIPLFILILLLLIISWTSNKITVMAYKDTLTDLFNRRYLFEFEKNIMANSRRMKYPLCLAMIDIDRFKLVNDNYGHDNGDLVLQNLVKTIKKNIRESDLFIRYGGEEFILILIDNSLNDAILTSKKLIKLIENSILLESNTITISMGLTKIYLDKDNFDSAIKRADTKLYKAKNTGRNKLCY